MKTIQIRDDFRLNLFSSTIINRLIDKGLFKLLGGVREKHLAEDEIKEFLKEVLEQGINDYDVVTLATQEAKYETSSSKETDGVWRMKIKIGDNNLTINKKDVIELAIKSYRAEAEKALAKY